jgi:hypothetical protein
MAVPAFDVATTILRRRRSRRGLMTPDRSHTHHRLIKFGLNPRMSVVILWGVTLFFGGQMLGYIAPHGLFYMMGSYIVAVMVANTILDQHRKNTRTISSDLRDEILYLAGHPGAFPVADAHDGMTLRELIVAQIRREAYYRRIVRSEAQAMHADSLPASVGDETREPGRATPGARLVASGPTSGRHGTSGGSPSRGAPAEGREEADLVLEDDVLPGP